MKSEKLYLYSIFSSPNNQTKQTQMLGHRRHRHRHRHHPPSSHSSEEESSEEEEEKEEEMMKCVSCKEEYKTEDAGTCRECYEEASETEEELKREIEELKSKVNFLRFWGPPNHNNYYNNRSAPVFTDVVLVAVDVDSGKPVANSVPIPANKSVLASRSPVFRAMLETEMEESLSGTIKLSDVSYDALCAFVNYLYTAEAFLDDEMACNLLILADKYEVRHLKTYCEKFLISKLNWENSLISYSFAHQHNAKSLLDAALSLILDNMDKLSKREEYQELVEKDPRLLVEIYEAYLSKQVNTAAASSLDAKVIKSQEVKSP